MVDALGKQWAQNIFFFSHELRVESPWYVHAEDPLPRCFQPRSLASEAEPMLRGAGPAFRTPTRLSAWHWRTPPSARLSGKFEDRLHCHLGIFLHHRQVGVVLCLQHLAETGANKEQVTVHAHITHELTQKHASKLQA